VKRQIDELVRHLYIDPSGLVVDVMDCVVTLKGRLGRRSQIAGLAEAIRGVDVDVDLDFDIDDLTEWPYGPPRKGR
jgi:hypothetical protein